MTVHHTQSRTFGQASQLDCLHTPCTREVLPWGHVGGPAEVPQQLHSCPDRSSAVKLRGMRGVIPSIEAFVCKLVILNLSLWFESPLEPTCAAPGW